MECKPLFCKRDAYTSPTVNSASTKKALLEAEDVSHRPSPSAVRALRSTSCESIPPRASSVEVTSVP